MPGTLVVTTLSDGTNSTSATNAIQGSAKAWSDFAGSTGTINASYNMSSISRSGTGSYTANFTNAFADANYAPASSARNSVNLALIFAQNPTGLSPLKSTSQLNLAAANFNSGSFPLSDPTNCDFAIFR
jgi:hypothetical protein